MSQDKQWQVLQEVAAEVRQEHQVPGLVVGLWHRGKMKTAGFGVTNVDHPLPVTGGTLFQIGSITKTFTGTAMMRLAADDRLDLDAPVRTYLPGFRVSDPDASSRATLRHLLTHTAGWRGDFFQDTGPGADALPEYMAAMAGLEQLAPLGTHISYSNSSFVLAGYVIERVTGKSYQEALRELVLDPLGLQHIYFDPGDVMVHRFAAGHAHDDGKARVAQPWPLPRYAYAAGGITCRAADLLRYAHFHLGDGTNEEGARLLPATALAEMHTPQARLWENESWGLSWRIDDRHEVRLLEHGGGTTGQISRLMLVPAHELALAIFTNSNQGNMAVAAIRRHVLREYLNIDVQTPRPLEAGAADLAPFAGKYTRPSMEIELALLCDRLTAQVRYKAGFPSQDVTPSPPPPPATLDLCAPDRLIVLNGIMKDDLVDVIRHPDGTIGWLRVGNRLHARQPSVKK